jgi:hypothetical protein
MRKRFAGSLSTLLVLLALPLAGRPQAPQQSGTLTVAGHSEHAPLVQMNGKSYVDIESLARLTRGAISFQANQVTLALPSPSASACPPLAEADKPQKEPFSEGFLRAGIEEMTVIREWRIAIVNAVQTNNPVVEDWVGDFRRSADSKLALASAAATTGSDRKAVELLRNEFNNMLRLSDQFLTMHKNATYTPPDSFANNPLDQKILGCARGLASMAAANQFQDEPSCH